MPQVEQTSKLQKIFSISLVLTIFFFCVNLILGYSLKGLEKDIEALKLFLTNAEDVRPNFEESLNLYTQGAKESILYVDTLRPDNETEYIDFISSVEGIGQNLSLNVNLESLDSLKPTNLGETLRYRVEFFGGEVDLFAFLKELEALPYYIRVDEVRYETLVLARTEDDLAPNIVLTIQLYVK